MTPAHTLRTGRTLSSVPCTLSLPNPARSAHPTANPGKRGTYGRRLPTPYPEGTLLAEAAPHSPLAALRQRSFLYFAGSRLLSGTAMTLTQAAVAWQVFQISGSALSLGLLGLVRFLPALGLSLVGGAVADSFDRRRVLMVAQLGPLAGSAVLMTATITDHISLGLIYGMVLLLAVTSAFENPSRQALLPLVVPREIFVNAVAVNSTIQQLGFVSGPVLAGAMIATLGVASAYALNLALVSGAIVVLLFIRLRAETTERRSVSLAAIKEGVQFVWRRQPLLGSMLLDMIAVIFAGAQAMLPIYAEEILHVGPRGYGLLTSSQAIGAFTMALVLVALPPVRRTGLVLILSVAGFGLFTVLFGISRSFPLSLAAYALTGAMDQISVVMRQTTIQLSTPDELRGRVSSVSQVFIGASNQLGSVESGLVAAVTNATFAVVSGGLGCIAVVGAIAAGMPELRRFRIGDALATAAHARPAPAPAALEPTRDREPTRAGD